MSVSDWKLIPIPPDFLERSLPICGDWLKEVYFLTQGRMTFPALLKAITRGAMQLWLVEGDGIVACVVTEILDYPNKRFCRVFLAVGKDGVEWANHVIEEIERYARFNECKGVEIVGRKGWVKLLKEYEVSYVLTKELL